MSDLPSERAVWNVRVFIGLVILCVYLGMLFYGIHQEAITFSEAFVLLGNAAGGGSFVAWLYK